MSPGAGVHATTDGRGSEADRREAAQQLATIGAVPWGGAELVAAVSGLNISPQAMQEAAAATVIQQEQAGAEMLEGLDDADTPPLPAASPASREERAATLLKSLQRAEKRCSPTQLAAAQGLLLEYLDRGLFAFDLKDLSEVKAVFGSHCVD